jgi:hypothetical protein
MWLGPTFLTVSAGQNVDEAHPSVRTDEFADAVQQQNHCEEKQQGDPGPDSRSRGLNDSLNEQVGDDHKRDRIDGKVQCSKHIHAGRGIKTTHVQLPLDSRRQGR